MLKPAEELWREGFAVGQRIEGGSRCPYCAGSSEAEVWEDGWHQGWLKREGCFHRETPSPSFSTNKGNEDGHRG